MTRRHSREQAFALIFQMNFQNLPVIELVETAIDSAEDGEDTVYGKYGVSIANAVQKNVERIDEIIEENSKKWKINRLSKVTISVLRLAIAEIEFVAEVPAAAVINEAVELAKKFGDDDDKSYVNGVLGGFVRSKPEQEQTGEN